MAPISLHDGIAAWLALQLRPMWKMLAMAEAASLKPKLQTITIDRPIYICGLPRCGTTILLQALALHNDTATHLERDFPFLQIPYLWSRITQCLPKKNIAYERVQGDGIMVTTDSPEAFDEVLWDSFIPRLHSPQNPRFPQPGDVFQSFEEGYRNHIRTLLYLRGNPRYLAKNNNLVFRLPYLMQLFPDARIILLRRKRWKQTESLVRQHGRFMELHRQQQFIALMMKAAAHYEFGPTRHVPALIDHSVMEAVAQAWHAGNEHLGYELLWDFAYSAPPSTILTIDYEDLCSDPSAVLQRIAIYAQIKPDEGWLSQASALIRRI